MPKVGSKHFAYTKKGAAQAKQHAAKTGQTVQHAKATPRPTGPTKRTYTA